MRRIWETLGKYLIRDPFFQDYTMYYLKKLFEMLRIPERILQFLLSILNYYRYYAYIA